MSVYYGASDSEIRRVCKYISDDKYIASLFGVTVWRVARVRKQLDKLKPEYSEGRNLVDLTPFSSGDNEMVHRKKMEEGSNRLREALMSFLYERQARINKLKEYGIKVENGKIMQC